MPSNPGGETQWIAVGVVRGAFGVQGALKVEPYTDAESTVLNCLRRWRIEGIDEPQVIAAGGSLKGHPVRELPFDLPAEVTVESAREHGGFIIATLSSAVSREQASALKGAEVLIDRKDFPAPDAGEYYWADLIGCQVVDPSGTLLGTVAALDDHGAQSVLRLDNRMLIPFVAACVLEVLPAQKRIVADWSADWL